MYALHTYLYGLMLLDYVTIVVKMPFIGLF